MDRRERYGLNEALPLTQHEVHSAGEHERNNAQPESCAICLEAIQGRAVAAPCNHLSFDFLCLAQWLQEHATCPLCKAEVKEVQYDWRAPDDFKTYIVGRHFKGKAAIPRHRRRTAAQRTRQRGSSSNAAPVVEDPSLVRRRQIYADRTPALHHGANRVSGYRDFTPATFASSPGLQTRARVFLRRELRIFEYLDRRPMGANSDYLVEYIVAVLKTHDPKGAEGKAEELLKEFLGQDDARLLLHELVARLRSPHETLDAWDAHVEYATFNRVAGPTSRNGQTGGKEVEERGTDNGVLPRRSGSSNLQF